MRYTKKAKCPTCLPDVVGAHFNREYLPDDDGKFRYVWRCNNCGHETVARTREAKRDAGGITKRQREMIDRIERNMLAYAQGFSDRPMEWKRFAWVASGEAVQVNGDIGYANDENSGLRFVRDHVSLFVGPNGSLYEISDDGRRVRARASWSWAIRHGANR